MELQVADEWPLPSAMARRLRLTSWFTGSTYYLADWDGDWYDAKRWIEGVAELQAGNVDSFRGRHGPTPWDDPESEAWKKRVARWECASGAVSPNRQGQSPIYVSRAVREWGLLLPAESLDGAFGGRGEEVDEIAIGIAEEDGAVSPGHECWLLLPVADDGLEPFVLSVHIVDHPFEDGGLIVYGACCVVEECRRTGVAESEGA